MAESTKQTEQMPDWAKDLLSAQQIQITNLQKQIGMLTDFAGQTKVQDWQRSQKDLTLKFANLKVYNGKLIVGWGKLDYTQFNPKAGSSYDEKILIELFFKDGTSEKINYSVFTNIKEFVVVQILSRTEKDATIKLDDGTEMSLNLSFLNQ